MCQDSSKSLVKEQLISLNVKEWKVQSLSEWKKFYIKRVQFHSYRWCDQAKSVWSRLKGHWTSSTSSPTFFQKKVGIFIPLKVMAWVKTACRVLRSRLTYFWRNMNISSSFYFSKSTSINTQYSSLWGTLKMMMFTKYPIKWKRFGKITWNFRYWFDFKSFIELHIKK